MPLISVIVPVYKVEPYLARCVDSILAQTLPDFELWLVDDGSPDGCPALCDAYAARDERVRVIHKKNGGLSSARNAALDKFTGQHVCFVDSDDYIAPDALETMFAALCETDADVAVGNMRSFDETGKEGAFYAPTETRTVMEGDEMLSTLNQPCAPNRLYKAAIYRALRFPEGRLYEDVFVYHKVLAQCRRMVLTGKVGYYYMIRSDSIMHASYDIRFTDIVDAIRERYEWLDAIGQRQLANEARLFIYSRVAVAYAHLDKKDPAHRERLAQITEVYRDCYRVLMKDDSVSVRQKLRLWMLYRLPALHTALFGRRMPLALG